MAKIILNNKEFNIDDAVIASVTNDLKQYLSTTMSGSGAKVSLGGVAYNIDSTKLSTATNEFISHLGTISGNGVKVIVGGVEYGVDSNKVSGAVSELGDVFNSLHSAVVELAAGLYVDGVMTKSWDELINEGTVAIEGSVLSSNADNITGMLVIADGITELGLSAFEGYQLTGVIIPDSVTVIGGSALNSCEYLTSVVIPDSVITIDEGAFNYCRNLSSVVIGNGVTSIGSGAFELCPLTSLEIPDSVTSIGYGAFSDCTLTSVVIGDSVTSIGENAFAYCPSLTEITFRGTIDQWNSITKGADWNDGVPATYVQCSDGQVAL